jgi:hypothetical protein
VFGAKSHAACSTLVVGPAELTPSLRASDMKVRTTASASTGAWKEQVRAACGAATPGNLLTGAIGPDLEFRLSSAATDRDDSAHPSAMDVFHCSGSQVSPGVRKG